MADYQTAAARARTRKRRFKWTFINKLAKLQVDLCLVNSLFIHILRKSTPCASDASYEEGSNMKARKIIAMTTHNASGGANEALARLCSGLIQRGHEVSLWYLYKKKDSNPPVAKFKYITTTDKPNLFTYLTIAFRFSILLLKHRPDALISFLPLANVLGQTTAWIYGIPVRIASQRNPVQTYSKTMQMLDLYVGTCGSYTHNVVNSSDVLASVSGYPWPYRFRTKVIYNGIDPLSLGDTDRSSTRRRFQIEDDETALVCVGRLTKQKNHAYIIQILASLKNFRLLIAGSGPELQRLRMEASRMGVSRRVRFLGILSQPEMRSLLDAADVFVLTSLYEGQSNALLEAMSAGKAIVASDIPSNRETLIGDQTEAGFVLPITEPDRWTTTLAELGGNVSKRRQLGKMAKIRARRFSLGEMCTGFERMIEASLSRSAGAR